jgi:hypothetical protein
VVLGAITLASAASLTYLGWKLLDAGLALGLSLTIRTRHSKRGSSVVWSGDGRRLRTRPRL